MYINPNLSIYPPLSLVSLFPMSMTLFLFCKILIADELISPQCNTVDY